MINPQVILQRMKNDKNAMNNPKVKEIMRMYENHDTQGIETFINNMAGEYGTNYDQVRNQFMNLFRIR